MTTPDHVRAHRHSSRNRAEVLASEVCGCFYCLLIFDPSAIRDWHGVGAGDTAICPECLVDSIIGSESGYPITREFLEMMRMRWFAGPPADRPSSAAE